ncbi:bZIP transcription factor [Phlyctema vagabunda]|uniref:BZIP transcription factor n=1 Tax=Phlyctema vagabunda TaxID=108571 RepID=A0ABR4P449_9HELO
MTEACQLGSASVLDDSDIRHSRPISTQSNSNNNKQRERKRALDRKAQRVSREKTRSHIGNLEKTVRILKENGSNATNSLLDEIDRLHTEIDRLNRIINGIKAVLGVDPSVDVRQAPQSKSDLMEGLAGGLMGPVTVAGVTAVSPVSEQNLEAPMMEDDDDNSVGTNMRALPKSSAASLARVHESSGANVSMPNCTNWWEQEGPILDLRSPKAYSQLPSPMHTTMSVSTSAQYLPCDIWQKANRIYANIFPFTKEKAALARDVEAGSLITVVKHGWTSLSLREGSNPILMILKDVDQNLFWDLDPVTKIANLYKSWLLLKATHSLDKLPQWQRPVWSQQTRQHPIPIDFFPWPALRDRLVQHHSDYLSTADFCTYYKKYFKFAWPFSFDDTYCYNASTKTYTINPVFERYYNDERYWVMEERFFEKYPEFSGKISRYKESQVSIFENLGQDAHAGHAESCEGSCHFTDARVLAMFDQYPDIV